jgi:hypothetical protein
MGVLIAESLTFTCPEAINAGIRNAIMNKRRNNFLMVQQNNEKIVN